MLQKHVLKNLLSRARRNPWCTLLSKNSRLYRIPEIGNSFIEMVDQDLFERRFDNAIRHSVIFEKWAEKDTCFRPKAKAALGTILLISGKTTMAEREIMAALDEASGTDNRICIAECERRVGLLLRYQGKFAESIQAYTRSIQRFSVEDNTSGMVINLVNRSVVKWRIDDYENALLDAEQALSLISAEMPFFYLVAGSVNIAAIYFSLGKPELARKKIEETQEMTKGRDGMTRARLILRWIRALLLEGEGDLKLASEMLDRVERKMVSLDMDSERKVLLADSARVARNPGKIIRIAEKAMALEMSTHVQGLISKVIRDPSRENIQSWRTALDSYVPPFPAAA